jgi:hypothetical protein
MSYLYGIEEWQSAYQIPENRKKIWIYIEFSNNSIIFLDEFKDWLTIQDYCNDHSLNILKLGIQYKTHKVIEDVSTAPSVYLIRSVRAEFGGDTKQCYTIGKVIDGVVHKTNWIIPELTLAFTSVDPVEECFEEAIVYNDRQKEKTSVI